MSKEEGSNVISLSAPIREEDIRYEAPYYVLNFSVKGMSKKFEDTNKDRLIAEATKFWNQASRL